ncbi:SpoIIE family protein phosphatase [Egbenema bharatensis]|uniref:SpoIIE family protein phosphatase n=1 Tax=Egbenema bharatensis TaxID=3463334 RepID=UPI003A8A414A
MKSLLKLTSRKISLRHLLIIPFVLQLSAAVGVTGYLTFLSGRESVGRLASQLRQEMSSRIEAELNLYLESPYQFNHINAASLAQGQVDLQNSQNAAQFLRQVQLSPFIYASYCGDESGEYLGVYRPADDRFAPPGMWVSNAASEYDLFSYDIDVNGNRQALVEVGNPYDPRQRPWYKSAVETGSATWGEVYSDFLTGLPTLTASEPVYDANDRLIGVCAIDVKLPQEFRQFLANLSIGQTGKAFVMERSGTLVSSSTDEPITVQQGDRITLIQATESTESLIRETAHFLKAQFGDFSDLTEAQQLDFSLNQERQFVQVLPLQNDRGLDWLIVLVVPESDFMAQIHASARTTFWLCLLTLGATTLSGILIARWVARPISQLGRASQLIAQGNLDQQVDIHNIEEIDTLGQSFNQMAGQLRQSFTELEHINQTLEARVEDRTAELKAANDEINLLNEKLQEDNLRMGAELNVARQLQQMILPKEQELNQIPDLDIAGFMEVATEVGGDYYDVIQRQAGVLVGIGDVTGHGLESGVLMIMAQTAIRALAAANDAAPATFLNAVNQVIYQNVQRMSPGKNLTLSLLDYRDEQLWLTGQHEEVLVVRADGNIERVDTIDLGFPLGMVDDITEFVAQVPIHLAPGDGIVLYTDGVIEAENDQQQLYGLERLMEQIQHYWQQSAIEIRRAIIADVQQHIGDRAVLDDITLVVLKKVNEPSTNNPPITRL